MEFLWDGDFLTLCEYLTEYVSLNGRFWFLVKDELLTRSFPELFDFLYCLVERFGKV